MGKKYFWDLETGDYVEATSTTKRDDIIHETVKPMSYAEEQLRHAEEKDRTFEPYYRGREYFLDEAKTIVCNDRENQYGSPEDNFNNIGTLWETYLDIKTKPYQLTATDVAIMMCLMKVARISSGSFKEDSWVDAIGYLACGAELDCAMRGDK